MGLLLVTPVILTASRATFARLVAERGTELAAMLVATAGVTLVAFSQQHFPLLHVVTPLLLWSAFRLGTFVTAAAALAVCSLAVAAALYGVGPIAELASGSMVQPTQFLHLFFSVEVLIPVVVALLTGERQGLIEELEQKNTELERFAYTVSHDLKGPLVTVEGFLSHLKHDLSTGSHEDIDEDMAEIERATRNMGELLTDLLELSRRGVVANRNDTVSMATILDDVLGSMSGAASVAVSVPAGLPPIRGDRGRLGVVIRNIVDNAQKFARDGQPAQLTVTAACGPDSVEFFFRDNGIGVAEEDLERVFELFQRLDSRTTGTGVGLAIVQRTVEAHGGKVWVESEGLNQGTTVVIRLPHGAETTATGADLDPRGHALGLAG
jgi:signal transduction histidine kinase